MLSASFSAGAKCLGLLISVALVLGAANVEAKKTAPLAIKIILAKHTEGPEDPQLKDLRTALRDLTAKMREHNKRELKSFQLKDELQVTVQIPSTTRLQLPISKWMVIDAKALDEKNQLHVDFKLEKFDFKASAVIAEGGTLAVGGPPFQDGWLILAVTRPSTAREP